METLTVEREELVHLFSFASTCATVDEAVAELVGYGWSDTEAHLHVEAACLAHAYVEGE
jgi:hypothetical protein